MTQIEEWRRLRTALTRSEFVERNGWPFLVSATPPGSEPANSVVKVVEFRTLTHERAAWSIQPPSGTGERVVLALRKSAANPFPERISIGRAPNCDVVVREPSVSKLHGHFRDVKLESAIFTDAKSANGTRLDGTRVEAGTAVQILRQCLIELGRVRFVLLSAADVYDWL